MYLKNSAFFILVLAFGLRVYALNTQSLWFDEGWSWHLARMNLANMADVTAGDRSPVLYYTLLHFWLGVAGESEFAMRFVSVLADMLTTAILFAFGRAIIGRHNPFNTLPALLWALCPWAIWFAQETRMYALLATLGSLTGYWLWRWLNVPRDRHLFFSALGLAGAIHTHYYGIFLLPAVALATLMRLPTMAKTQRLSRIIMKCTLAVLGVMMTVLPWLWFAARGFDYNDGFVFPLNTIDGRTREWFRAFLGAGFAHPPEWQVWVLLGMMLVGAIGHWRAHGTTTAGYLLVLAVLPIIVAAMAVRVVYPYRSVFHPRYLIYCAPFVCLLVCGVLAHARVRQIGRGGAISHLPIVVVLGLIAMWAPQIVANYTNPGIARDDTRAAVKHVVEALEPGDVIVMQRDNFAARYYFEPLCLSTGKCALGKNILSAPAGLHGVLASANEIIGQINTQSAKRVRLLLWQDDVVDPQKLLESTLWANGFQIGELNYRQIRMPLFAVQSPIAPMVFDTTQVQFGEALQMIGVWHKPSTKPGDWVYVVLRWQAKRPIPADYKVFLHVLDAKGTMQFQRDKLALSELMPMTAWQTGAVLQDPYALIAPTNLPAGTYSVVMGVYDPNLPNTRLPATQNGSRAPNDAVQIASLQIVR